MKKGEFDLSKIQPHPTNPRTISAEEVQFLERSLQANPKFLTVHRIAYCLKNGYVFGGNQRLKALLKLGYTHVPNEWVEDITDWSEEEKIEFMFIDNKQSGEWDWDIINTEYEALELGDWGIVEQESSPIEPEQEELILECVEDDYNEEAPEIPKTVLGDLYEIGEHRLICGDSTQTDTFEKLMQGELADMVVTDPTYNVAYEGKTKDALTIDNDNLGNDDFYKFLYDFYSALTTAVKKGGAIYVWHASSEIANFGKAMVDAGWLLKQQLIWVKNTMVMGRQDYQWRHEACLYGWLKGDSHNWYSDRKQTTVIEWDRPQRNGEHPTMKPIGLFGYQIENSSKVGDLVIDAFGGSGTAMVACEQLKRKARVVELDTKYCDVIIKRMLKLDSNLTVKRNGKSVTSEFV